MCKAGDVSLTLTLLEKESFENRMELFEYRDNFSKQENRANVTRENHNKCSLRT